MQEETFESTQHDPGEPGTEMKKEGGNPAGRNNLSYLRIFDEVTPEELEGIDTTEEDWIAMVEAVPALNEELKEGKIGIKDMATGEQELVNFDEFLSQLSAHNQ